MKIHKPRKPFSLIREFHLADWFTLANAVCGTGAMFSMLTYLQTTDVLYIYFAGGMVFAALVFDVLDGRIARWRQKTSGMGRELDSLADVISFGVAPALIGYGCGMQGFYDRIRNKPAYADTLNDAYIEHLIQSAPLHDLGKVGILDHILLKPGRLTTEEFEEIKRHTQYGKRIIDAAQVKLGDASFLRVAGEMAVSHHEHWDGKGYPNGLKGEEIPLSGRIMAIADVYDTLISGRPYEEGISHEKAVEIILAGQGSKFDPQLIDAFGEIHATFHAIARRFADASVNETLHSTT